MSFYVINVLMLLWTKKIVLLSFEYSEHLIYEGLIHSTFVLLLYQTFIDSVTHHSVLNNTFDFFFCLSYLLQFLTTFLSDSVC